MTLPASLEKTQLHLSKLSLNSIKRVFIDHDQSITIKTYMDAPEMSTYYFPLRADFQHKLRC
jgi:hypothetical protein